MSNEDLKWVFLSHSNKDYKAVREVRNRLEEKGLYPIMFYLKCLEGEPDDSVLEMIRKEIDARSRFILCNSENALKSYWVQKEVEYIKSRKKPYEIVNLENANSIMNGVNTISKRSQVLLISSRVEMELTKRIEEVGFRTHDLNENIPVYNLLGGMEYQQYESMCYHKIVAILKRGYCLFLFYADSWRNTTEKMYLKMIISIVQNDGESMNYFIPVIMEKVAGGNVEILSLIPNFLDVSDYSESDKVLAIVGHIHKIDLMKNK